MTIEHVEHVYETAKERLLFTLNIDFDRRLDITPRDLSTHVSDPCLVRLRRRSSR